MIALSSIYPMVYCKNYTIPVISVNRNSGENVVKAFESGYIQVCWYGPLAALPCPELPRRSDVLLLVLAVDITCSVNILRFIATHVRE